MISNIRHLQILAESTDNNIRLNRMGREALKVLKKFLSKNTNEFTENF